ncbi:hypothetical protein ACWDRR_33655 [Kitasatospora sp. NPDC003701]
MSDLLNARDKRVGRVMSDGWVFDLQDRQVGRVMSNGWVYDARDRRVGSVRSTGNTDRETRNHGGAALLLRLLR